MATRYHDRMHVVDIDGIGLPALLALVWNPTASPALSELIRHARDAFSSDSPASLLQLP